MHGHLILFKTDLQCKTAELTNYISSIVDEGKQPKWGWLTLSHTHTHCNEVLHLNEPFVFRFRQTTLGNKYQVDQHFSQCTLTGLTLILLSWDVCWGVSVYLKGEQHLASSLSPCWPLQVAVVSAQEEEGVEAWVEAGWSASQIHADPRHQSQEGTHQGTLGSGPQHLCFSDEACALECMMGQRVQVSGLLQVEV